ncbi:hypothetical protein IQ246_20420 [aff. Roholtiella sp. LEGE 12411]|nr:hypothetical protein [aff. Roholtiella sp. LEGE 12411]
MFHFLSDTYLIFEKTAYTSNPLFSYSPFPIPYSLFPIPYSPCPMPHLYESVHESNRITIAVSVA